MAPTVAFRADGLLAVDLAPGFPAATTLFEVTVYDLQNGAAAANYTAGTSVFTAPINGIYRFAATLLGSTAAATPTGSTECVFTIQRLTAPNLPVQQGAVSTGSTDYRNLTVVAAFSLAAGDQVGVSAVNPNATGDIFAIPPGQPFGTVPGTVTFARSFEGSLIMPL